MIFPLFEREISYAEAAAAVKEIGIELMPVLANGMETNADTSKEIDKNLLCTVLKMLDRAVLRVHLAYEYRDAMQPLVSMYIFGEHMLSCVYTRQGMGFSEMLAPADVKAMIFRVFEGLELRDSGDDRSISIDPAMKLPDFFAALTAKELEGAELSELQAIYADSPRLCCVFDQIDRNPSIWQAVHTDTGIYCIFADADENVRLGHGSALPMMDGISRRFIGAFRDNLKLINSEKLV